MRSGAITRQGNGLRRASRGTAFYLLFRGEVYVQFWYVTRLLRYDSPQVFYERSQAALRPFRAWFKQDMGGVMHKYVRRLGIATILAGLFCLEGRLAFAQTKDDPFIGRWVLDRAKSEYSGAPPEKRTTVFELTPAGIRHMTDTVVANGSTDRVEYTAKYDGQDVQISNSFLWTVSLKRIDARTIERSGKVMGMVVETSTRTVSPDGQTLTITTSGTNGGNEYSSTQVFTREKP
jgi:hypothetical protein